MPRQTVAANFQEVRAASASAGDALTTTAAYRNFLPGTNWFSLSPRNFSTAVVARWILSPYLAILKNQDALATEPVDCSYLLQDNSTTVTMTLNSFDTLANGDALYIGSHEPFGGVYVDVQNVNGNAADIAAVYYNGKRTTLTVTDNTDTGAVLAQDGTITWTVPTDWQAATFDKAFGPSLPWIDKHNPVYTLPLFWVRFDYSAALDSSVSINAIYALNRSSAYSEIIAGAGWEQSVKQGLFGYSGVTQLTDAGTANMVITCGTYGRFGTAAAVAQ